MRGKRSRLGERSTITNGPTAAWITECRIGSGYRQHGIGCEHAAIVAANRIGLIHPLQEKSSQPLVPIRKPFQLAPPNKPLRYRLRRSPGKIQFLDLLHVLESFVQWVFSYLVFVRVPPVARPLQFQQSAFHCNL